MLIGYARVSKADGSQSLDLQHDALRAAGVERDNIYDDLASGGRDDRPGLTACLKSLRDGDVLVVWKLDRLGRSLAHLVNTVKELSDRKIGLRVLTGCLSEAENLVILFFDVVTGMPSRKSHLLPAAVSSLESVTASFGSKVEVWLAPR